MNAQAAATPDVATVAGDLRDLADQVSDLARHLGPTHRLTGELEVFSNRGHWIAGQLEKEAGE